MFIMAEDVLTPPFKVVLKLGLTELILFELYLFYIVNRFDGYFESLRVFARNVSVGSNGRW